MRVLVTGATGYIGSRLVPQLLDAGHEVRCLARAPEKLDAAEWRSRVEVVAGDLLDPGSLAPAFADMDAVFYLVHSIGAGADWEADEARAAANARDAAGVGGLSQIVYLGGLGEDGGQLSKHLASRQRVGAVLASGNVPVTELRAAVVIGAGSASFEMLRYLVDVLPVMVTPRWVETRCQPIAVADVLAALVAALRDDGARGRVVEIGGPDVLTYREMMTIYAQEAGLPRRRILRVPVLTPRLSSLWVGLVTPLPPSLARPLIDSLVNEVVVRDGAAASLLPASPIPFRDAVRLALRHVHDLDVSEASGPRPRTPADTNATDPPWAGGSLLADERVVDVAASPEHVFAVVSGIGGARGWYAANWLWGARGVIDVALGGVGHRRGRVHPDRLSVGDVVDAWRVERIEPQRFLRLRAEMRVPGRAWLEWEIRPQALGARLVQRARFAPRGLLGRVYWYAVAPFHALLFPRLARALARAAERTRAKPPDQVVPALPDVP